MDGSNPATGAILGGHVLLPEADEPVPAALRWEGSTITDLHRSAADDASTGAPPATVLDAEGCLVLPGLVDVHGDAFERSVMPRPGVSVDLEVALDETAALLLAAGITTAFLSVTDSWEPGLRSRSSVGALVDALGRHQQRHPDLRLHVRHERCLTDDLDRLLGWIRAGRVDLLSYNDHTPGGITMVRGISDGQVARAGCDRESLERLQDEAVSRRAIGLEQERLLAAAAAEAGCPTASHDSSTEDDLARDRSLGVAIAEFPTTVGLANRYREAGVDVLVGAPNLVRGSSHLGNLSARDAVVGGAGSLVCSDYHYPSLLQAPFVLADTGQLSFGAAWATCSTDPAAATGLDDRGRLEPGARADVVVIEPPRAERPARVRAVVSGGVVAYQAQLTGSRP